MRSSNDEFSVFGQLIAKQLAQLPIDEAIRLQQEIQTKINESRLRNIHNSSKTTSLSSTHTSSSLNIYEPILQGSQYDKESINSYVPTTLRSEYEQDPMNLNNVDAPPSAGEYFTNWSTN